jgi:hypothetical protein
MTRKNLPLLESGQPDFVALLMMSMLQVKLRFMMAIG